MKSSIIWIVLLVALAGTVAFLLIQRDSGLNPFASKAADLVATTTPPLTFDQATVYTCAGGGVVAAAFKTGDTTMLEVSLPDMSPILMTQTEAASGAKYIHESGLAFWEKGGVVLVERSGEVIYAECKVPGAVITETATTSTTFSGTQWVWNETSFDTATSVEPNEPEDFILTFADNNTFSANTDCNNVGGKITGGADGVISFTEMVSTLMACEGETREAAFVSQLGYVTSYTLDDTQLVLTLSSAGKNGKMKFTKK